MAAAAAAAAPATPPPPAAFPAAPPIEDPPGEMEPEDMEPVVWDLRSESPPVEERDVRDVTEELSVGRQRRIWKLNGRGIMMMMIGDTRRKRETKTWQIETDK